MPPLNYTRRKWAVASAVLDTVSRERPDDFRELSVNVRAAVGHEQGGNIGSEADGIVNEWCAKLNLGCAAIELEALWSTLAVNTPLNEDGDEPAQYDEDGSYCRIPWIPGESKSRFVARALAEFYRRQKEEIDSGGPTAHDRINPKHVDWFVRFQVNGEGYDRIARTDNADRSDVKRAVRALADLLELTLRPSAAGRPKGSGVRKRRAVNIVRRKKS